MGKYESFESDDRYASVSDHLDQLSVQQPKQSQEVRVPGLDEEFKRRRSESVPAKPRLNKIIKRMSTGLMNASLRKGSEPKVPEMVKRKGVYTQTLSMGMDGSNLPLDLAGVMDAELAASHQELLAALAQVMNENFVSEAQDMVPIIDEYQQRFEKKNWEVVMCTKGGKKSSSWLEFIDRGHVSRDEYVSQFNVQCVSVDTITTLYRTLTFPEGVAVERLHFEDGKEKLLRRCPASVKVLVRSRGLEREYATLVDEINESRPRLMIDFKCKDIAKILQQHQAVWEERGIRIFVSKKEEYERMSRGKELVKYSHRWLEFCDLRKIPNYQAERGRVD